MKATRRSFLKTIGYLTGSMAFLGSGNDEDWVIEDQEAFIDSLREEGALDLLEDCGYYNMPENDFWITRYNGFNFICINNPTFQERWREAHEYCMIVKPKNKKDRRDIFRAFLFNEGCNPHLLNPNKWKNGVVI